jgi:hypothetical protein
MEGTHPKPRRLRRASEILPILLSQTPHLFEPHKRRSRAIRVARSRCRRIVEIEEHAAGAPNECRHSNGHYRPGRRPEEISMASNDKYFVPPEATQTLLRVRGFSPNGQRSGGIESPEIVDLPSGTVLFRMYHDPTRDYGEWWATPRELAVIASYFGRGGPAFDEGRVASSMRVAGSAAGGSSCCRSRGSIGRACRESPAECPINPCSTRSRAIKGSGCRSNDAMGFNVWVT